MLSIIVAVAKNNVIGKDNRLLWNLPGDLKRFKDITTGKSIIMGRKTFESLPFILPNRQHIVLTRDKNFVIEDDNVVIVNSIEELQSRLDKEKENFVIGGGEIYKLLLPYCDKLYLTLIDREFDGDTIFPNIDLNDWNRVNEVEENIIKENTMKENGIKYKFMDFIRK